MYPPPPHPLGVGFAEKTVCRFQELFFHPPRPPCKEPPTAAPVTQHCCAMGPLHANPR